MKKAYQNPDLVVIALDLEDIVTASAATTPGGSDTSSPDVTTDTPTTETDLNMDLWVPTVTDNWD